MTKTATLAEQFARERGITRNPDGPLSARQERFCTIYFETGNAVAAYRLAYGTQAKRSTVSPKAYRLMGEPKIARRVQELRDRAANDAVMSVALVLQELKRVALFDPRSIMGEDGVVLPLDEMPSDAAAAIAAIEIEEHYEGDGPSRVSVGSVKRIRFWDKVTALDKAMKHLGMYERNHQQKTGLFEGVPRPVLRELERRLAAMVEKKA